MDLRLPANAPRTTQETFAHIRRLMDGADVDDLKILALAEAIGQQLYDDLAEQAQSPQVRELLLQSGREEMLHAHRVGQAIEILTGEPFPIPPIGENPLYTTLDPTPLTKASLTKLAQGEYAGEALYAGVASRFTDPQVLAIFAQNGREEVEHGERLQSVIALLGD